MSSSSQKLSPQSIQEHWDDFSSEEVDWIDGNVNNLIEALITKYGVSADEAAMQIEEFMERPADESNSGKA